MPARLALAALTLVAGATRASDWAPEGADLKALVAGRAVSAVAPAADGAALITAAIDIPARPRTVWAVMNDCADMKRIITSLVVCRTLEADEHGAWSVREQVTRGNLIVPTLHNVVHSDFQPFRLIRFHKVGGDLRVEQGEWRLEPLDGGQGTRVIYVNLVAADIPIPGPFVREGLKRDTAKVMVNLRKECVNAGRSGV